jgi:hypothetical protein
VGCPVDVSYVHAAFINGVEGIYLTGREMGSVSLMPWSRRHPLFCELCLTQMDCYRTLIV